MIVTNAAISEFNDYMDGSITEDQLSEAGKAYLAQYLEGYWLNIDSLCQAA